MSIAPQEMGTKLARKLCIMSTGSQRVNNCVFQYHMHLIYSTSTPIYNSPHVFFTVIAFALNPTFREERKSMFTSIYEIHCAKLLGMVQPVTFFTMFSFLCKRKCLSLQRKASMSVCSPLPLILGNIEFSK